MKVMKVMIADVFVEQPWAPDLGQGRCDGREGQAGWKSGDVHPTTATVWVGQMCVAEAYQPGLQG